VGVEPEARPAARDALRQGAVVDVGVVRTLMDGQQTTDIGQRPLEVFLALVDEVVGVSDDEVADTVRTLALRTKQVVEPSGASALAAVLTGRLPVSGNRVGVVLSGGNVAPEVLARLLTRR
jgi:threonine dehydratase